MKETAIKANKEDKMKQPIVSFQVDEQTLLRIDDTARSERKSRSKWIREALLKALPTNSGANGLTSPTKKEKSGIAG